MERQEIEKKKQNSYLKLLESWERDQGMHEVGKKNKGISELRQGENWRDCQDFKML